MKAAVIGYGKMGHAVERFLRERGHRVACTIDAGEEGKFGSAEFRSCDVAIEFSRPEAAVDNITRALEAGVAVVSGTTGWTARWAEVCAVAESTGGKLLWSSNFSIGVNLFRNVTANLARLMGGFPQYRAEMEETHHIHKLDHPSGTAITLAEGMIAAHPGLEGWEAELLGAGENPAEGFAKLPGEGILPILCRREGEVPGTHTVRWTSPVDAITLEHKAFSRDGFALGAVMAAEWLAAGKTPGVKGMEDFMAQFTAPATK